MEAATASSMGGSWAGLGFARSSQRPSGARCRSPTPLSFRHPPSPWPASRLVRRSGARTWGTAAAANPHQQQQQQQLGVEGGAVEPERGSPREVREEIARCYELVGRLGRGAVYLRSSRAPPTHPHYHQATELAREIARLLDSGASPGLMDAANQGALEADKPVGGFKIAKEAGEWTTSNFPQSLTSPAGSSQKGSMA